MTTRERLAIAHRAYLKNACTFRRVRNQARNRGDERTAAIAQSQSDSYRAKALKALEELRNLEPFNRVPFDV